METESFIIPLDDQKHKVEQIDQLTEDDKRTFQEITYNTVVLKAGMQLSRFISEEHHNPFSNCWVDQETLTELTSYFHYAENLSLNARREYIRDQLGIKSEWSKLNYRVKVRLKRDIIAYLGSIAPQKVVMEFKSMGDMFEYKNKEDNNRKRKEDENRKIDRYNQNKPKEKRYDRLKVNEYRIGGFKQYFIPRLKNISLKGDINEYAEVVHSNRMLYKGRHYRP